MTNRTPLLARNYPSPLHEVTLYLSQNHSSSHNMLLVVSTPFLLDPTKRTRLHMTQTAIASKALTHSALGLQVTHNESQHCLTTAHHHHNHKQAQVRQNIKPGSLLALQRPQTTGTPHMQHSQPSLHSPFKDQSSVLITQTTSMPISHIKHIAS